MAAELLGEAALLTGADQMLARRIAVERAAAQIKSGQLAAAATTARTGLRAAADPGQAAALIRILLLSLTSRGQVDEVDRLVTGLLKSARLSAAAAARLQAQTRLGSRAPGPRRSGTGCGRRRGRPG